MREIFGTGSRKMLEVFGAAAIGLALLVIGNGVENKPVSLIGIFILPLAFLWGGLYKAEESTPLKITFLAIAGLLLALAVESLFTTGINLRGLLG